MDKRRKLMVKKESRKHLFFFCFYSDINGVIFQKNFKKFSIASAHNGYKKDRTC